MNRLFVGVEIGGTKLQIIAGGGPPSVTRRFRTSVDPERQAQGILDDIQSGMAQTLDGAAPAGIGVAFGGPVDRRTQTVIRSHQISGWQNFPLGQWFRDRWPGTIAIDNDANLAGLAESLHGAGRDQDPVFYVTLGSGVGGGLVRQGRIYHGAAPTETEIGHVRLERTGLILEQACSGWAVNEKVRRAVAVHPEDPLANEARNHERHEARALGPALAANSPLAHNILRSTGDDLAYGLSHAIHLLHPQTIVLGGGLSLIGEPLRSSVAAALPDYVMAGMLPPPTVRLAQLGEEVTTVGALLLAEQTARGTRYAAELQDSRIQDK